MTSYTFFDPIFIETLFILHFDKYHIGMQPFAYKKAELSKPGAASECNCNDKAFPPMDAALVSSPSRVDVSLSPSLSLELSRPKQDSARFVARSH